MILLCSGTPCAAPFRRAELLDGAVIGFDVPVTFMMEVEGFQCHIEHRGDVESRDAVWIVSPDDAYLSVPSQVHLLITCAGQDVSDRSGIMCRFGHDAILLESEEPVDALVTEEFHILKTAVSRITCDHRGMHSP